MDRTILQLENWEVASEAGQLRAGREVVALVFTPVELVGLERSA